MFEKKAEEYARKYVIETYELRDDLPIWSIKQDEDLKRDFYAFLAGYKTEKPQWHKVSEQTPTEEKDYLVKLTDGTVDVMRIATDGNLEPYVVSLSVDFYRDVEKWCEIPEDEE